MVRGRKPGGVREAEVNFCRGVEEVKENEYS